MKELTRGGQEQVEYMWVRIFPGKCVKPLLPWCFWESGRVAASVNGRVVKHLGEGSYFGPSAGFCMAPSALTHGPDLRMAV